MRKHFKPLITVAVTLSVCSLSPLDHCAIEFKIHLRDEYMALYGFVSLFVCVSFYAGPGSLPSRTIKYLKRGLRKPLNVRPCNAVYYIAVWTLAYYST
jgi:hypothetical protein